MNRITIWHIIVILDPSNTEAWLLASNLWYIFTDSTKIYKEPQSISSWDTNKLQCKSGLAVSNKILREQLKLLPTIISEHDSNKNMIMSHLPIILRLKLIFRVNNNMPGSL